jgi:hypothetical protein
MNRPSERAEADEPDDASPHEEEESGEQAPLNQLSESGKKEAANGGENIAGGSLSFVHRGNIEPARDFRKRFSNCRASGFYMTCHGDFANRKVCRPVQ